MYVRNPPRCTQKKMRGFLSVFVFKKEPAKSLVSATFFTERERPTEIVMHKRRTVFSRL